MLQPVSSLLTKILTNLKNIWHQIPEAPDRNLTESLIKARRQKIDSIIVLDDDPTGTQTVHGIPVLTQWTQSLILAEFEAGTELFYILTNSRSLTESEAVQLTTEITQNIVAAARKSSKRFWIISRSDSTLRGHYPAEVQAIESCLDMDAVQFIIPCFFEGGRITVNDTHYVKKDDSWIPAAETTYANDPVFGYKNSNLKLWVQEKYRGQVTSQQVKSITLDDLRQSSIETLTQKISNLPSGTQCVVNATTYSDLEFFCLALLSSNIQPLMRTAASLVAALGCLGEKELLKRKDIASGVGGLVVVGSFVSTTTAQLNHLLEHHDDLVPIELEVSKILASGIESELELISKKIGDHLQKGTCVVIYTSRELITGSTEAHNQQIGKKISAAISQIVKSLQVMPGFLISKGGITSSDLATDAMSVRKALVLGQVIKGVPVWKLGSESKFPGLCQVIFPGNVGEASSLTEVVKILSTE